MAEESQAVHIDSAYLPPVRLPIKAARLLNSAPDWVLLGPGPIIYAILLTCLAYSFWAVRDDLVLAPLQLEREQVTIESVTPGMVTEILVNDGDRVESQAPLLRVRPTTATYVSDKESLTRTKDDLEKQLKQEDDEYKFNVVQLKRTKEQLDDSLKNLDTNRKNLLSQIETAKQNVTFREGKLADARKDFATEQKLFNQKDITKVELDHYHTAVVDLEKSVFDAKEEVKRQQASLAALSKEQIIANIDKNADDRDHLEKSHEDNEDKLKAKLAEITDQLKKEEAGLVQGVSNEGMETVYRSTFSGNVAQVHVKQGQLINPGISLVTVVKESAALLGRVLVQNKDIGRLAVGQRVMIKYFAYPYQEYGIPEGRISSISSKPGGVSGQDSMYLVQVVGISETIAKEGDKVPKHLEMGLEGTAEIKVGEKRFIELLFSPISRFFTQAES